ncbi:outer membrane beta-barrel protein [Albibacterium profundi]|uniref:Outer membrane beta-barrel protein n=1 Tax=Albibacterium profundi TaxID=3134906 RepID=A0ABV5CBA4_9SPHI
MKKLVLVCLLLTAFSIATYAQKGAIDINAGVDVALPLGDFGEGFGTGFGATAKGLYGVSDEGQVGLTLGYIHFGSKEDLGEGNSVSFGVIPILALYRHHFGSLYVEPQIGLSSNRSKITVSSSEFNFGGSASSTSLGYAAGIGYMLGDIDISARYQGLSRGGSSSGFAAIRIAYNFSL